MSKEKTVKSHLTVMTDYLICLIAISVLSVYYYGWRAVIVLSVAVVTSFLCDIICVKFRGKKLEKGDISSVISALIFALLCPASVPYEVLIISCIFMIVIGKQAFGGNDNRIFNCTAVALVFATLCFKESMYMYPSPEAHGQVDFASYVSDNLVKSFTQTVDMVSDPSFDTFDMILGKVPGPMGATCIILIAVCAFVLIARRSISLITFFTCIVSAIGAAVLFPEAVRGSIGKSVIYEVFSGATLFVTTFVASDINYLPKTRYGKAIYGICAGLLSVFIRRYAGIEISLAFAVIIVNPLADFFDVNSVYLARLFKAAGRFLKRIPRYIKNFFLVFVAVIVILITRLINVIVNGIKALTSKTGSSGNSKKEIHKAEEVQPDCTDDNKEESDINVDEQ